MQSTETFGLAEPLNLTEMGRPLLDSTPAVPGVCQSSLCIVCQQKTDDVCLCRDPLCTDCVFSLTFSGANHSALCKLLQKEQGTKSGIWADHTYVALRAMPYPIEAPLSFGFEQRETILRKLLQPLHRYSVAVMSIGKSGLFYSTFAHERPFHRQDALHKQLRSHMGTHPPTLERLDLDKYCICLVAVVVVLEMQRHGKPEALMETLYRHRDGTQLRSTAVHQRFGLTEVDGGYVLAEERPAQTRWACHFSLLEEQASDEMRVPVTIDREGRAARLGRCVFDTKYC